MVLALVAGMSGVVKAQQAEPFDPSGVVGLLELVIDADEDSARQCLAVLSGKIQTGELSAERLAELRPRLEETLGDILRAPDHALHSDVALLAASWKNPQAVAAIRQMVLQPRLPVARRLEALQALVAAGDSQAPSVAGQILKAPADSPAEFRGEVLAALGRLAQPEVARVVLENYPQMETSLQPKAVQLLIQRPAWSKQLLQAIGDERIPRTALNVNHVRQLLDSPDKQLAELVRQQWGAVRNERNPQREEVIAEMQQLIRTTSGDAMRGEQVFHKLCGQCHKIYGKGQDVGPDITANGRSSFQQLLSNVFDPSLVIGASYQARTVLTDDGRILTGLPAEDSPQRVVLKTQGGKQEIIPRDAIEEIRVSPLSLMPEGVEKQLKPQELADLFEFLTLDKHPSDPTAQYISGTHGFNLELLRFPNSVHNLLVDAKTSSNTSKFGEGRRGAPNHMIFDTREERFLVETQWHEDGIPYQGSAGVLDESNAVWWMAEWDAPVRANTISLSGTYPNQPQRETAWKVEVRETGEWTTLERGTGGWLDSGRFLWGGPGMPARAFDALRISAYSGPSGAEVKSLTFRGEPFVSWIVADVPATTLIESASSAESDR